MNRVEKDEISQLPDKYRPLTMWSIIGWNILFNLFFGISFILTGAMEGIIATIQDFISQIMPN